MGLRFVFILYAVDDFEEAGEIANAVRDAGWAVCFGRLAEPGADHETSTAERLGAASCVLAVWSANAETSSVLRSDMLEAAQQQKLVLVTLDDAAPAVAGQARVQLQNWREGADPGAIASMIAKVEAYAGPRRRRRGRIIPFLARRELRRSWLAGAGAVAGFFLGAALILLTYGQGAHDPVVQRPVENSTSTREVARGADGRETAASMVRWAQIPAGDLPAIRRFIREHKGTWAADEAQQHVQRLEQFAWRKVLSLDDLAAQLGALAAFRTDYPDGAYYSAAVELEDQRREALERIETGLISLGYIPALEHGDLAAMRLGVEAFERATGLTPSGRITENLSASLAVAVESKVGAVAR